MIGVRIRYAGWTGTQDPFGPAVSADDVMKEVADDLLRSGDVDSAVARLLRRGMSRAGGPVGLDELRVRVIEARRREAQRLGADGPLRRVAERLEAILDRERTALEYDPRDEARLNELALAELPAGLAARISALESYAFTDAGAGAAFRALVDELRREVAEAAMGRLAGALGSMGPGEQARVAELLRDLNDLIDRDARGEDVTTAFRAFMERHGDLIPGDPETLDDLLAELARRAETASSLMAAMSPDQRAQLAQLAAEILGDDVAAESARLGAALAERFPELRWHQAPPGADPNGADAPMGQTLDWVDRLSEMDDLATALGQQYPGAALDDIDEDALRDVLGAEAVGDLHSLREIERALEAAGAARRGEGRLELTPRGIRQLGQTTLARIYSRAIEGATGSHRAQRSGGDGELTGTTRPLGFGDPFRLDVARTIRNGLLREAGSGAHGSGVRLEPEDFELAEAEQRVRAATVLLLDMSFSMPLRGNWEPAKQVALALHSLVSLQFPEDRFSIVGFSDYARRLQPGDLLVSGWERVYGTNMQHAFRLARRLLDAHPGADKQVIMVTDGEPTAHLDGDVPYFAWPPEPVTLRLTMREAARLARTGATLNVFLLDHDPGAAAFIERMVAAYGGRIFYPDLDDLGKVVVDDFLDRRS